MIASGALITITKGLDIYWSNRVANLGEMCWKFMTVLFLSHSKHVKPTKRKFMQSYVTLYFRRVLVQSVLVVFFCVITLKRPWEELLWVFCHKWVKRNTNSILWQLVTVKQQTPGALEVLLPLHWSSSSNRYNWLTSHNNKCDISQLSLEEQTKWYNAKTAPNSWYYHLTF